MRPAEGDLSVESVFKSFRGIAAVCNASFTVKAGAITALIGPNGAGKTTMFDLISGFQTLDAGRISHAGKTISGLPAEEIAHAGVVRTFQLTRIFAGVSVLDNMLVGVRDHPGERLRTLLLRPRVARRTERAQRARALELLEQFGLQGKATDLAGTLSGGQRKLLELARALMTEPRMLLLDEPLAGVNPTLSRRLLAHMERLRDDGGVTVLFVEHDLEAVMRHADHVLVMAAGTLLASGPPEVVRKDRRVLDAYLGLGRDQDTGAVQRGADG